VKLLVIGNSGSGKSTFARRISAGVAYLELDMIVWEPHQIAVARPIDVVRDELSAFLANHDAWVIEGCDGDLAELVLPACSELVFLNPGVDACIANNRGRPWEPHKYDSAEDQERMLPLLLDWVAGYYTRTDPRSYAFHRRLYDAFAGAKREIR
jgi:adenylate kinase family enzyme